MCFVLSNFHLQSFFYAFKIYHPPLLNPEHYPLRDFELFLSIDIVHMFERMGWVIICDSICSLKKGPSNYQVSKFIFPVAFRCCSFKCFFEGKNCIPSLHEQYHTVRFTSKQLNTFPSIVFKVFHFLYFLSLVNKAASCKSECLKLGF